MNTRILPLVWKNIRRNRRRAVITVLGVAVAIFVVSTLSAVIAAMTFPVREVGATRLLKVREKARANVLASRLPESLENRVAEIPGVAGATGVLSDLAVLGEEGVHIFVRGVDPERYQHVRGLEVSEDAWSAFREDRKAALAGHRLVTRMGWEVGDEIEIDVINLQVRIAGVIPEQGIDLESHLLVRRDYLQAVREARREVSYLLVAPAEGIEPLKLAAAIDEVMSVSPVPTQTATAAAFAEAVVEDFLGFVEYLQVMRVIAVLITLLGAANAIAMNVRDRTREIGLLRALGFPPALVFGLILLESTGLAVIGGLVGLAFTALILGNQAATLAGLELSGAGVILGALLSAFIGFAGGVVPALSAARLTPVDALRFVD